MSRLLRTEPIAPVEMPHYVGNGSLRTTSETILWAWLFAVALAGVIGAVFFLVSQH